MIKIIILIITFRYNKINGLQVITFVKIIIVRFSNKRKIEKSYGKNRICVYWVYLNLVRIWNFNMESKWKLRKRWPLTMFVKLACLSILQNFFKSMPSFCKLFASLFTTELRTTHVYACFLRLVIAVTVVE